MTLSHFLQYHNAIPIAFSIMLLGAGGAFAASNPQAIYSENQSVVSIDNTYIASKNLAAYSPRIEITNVSEDEEYYYVSYTFFTVGLEDAVWQDVERGGEMKVSKVDLGQYRDLGLYVTEQLKQIVDREVQRLAETQEIEKKNVTQKKVATKYGGLVGKFLDDKTEELPGYTPVVTPPPPPPPQPFVPSPVPVSQVAVAVVSESAPAPAPEPTPTPVSEPAPVADPNAGVPTMQIIGDTLVRVTIGSSYTDLGASVTGPTQQDLGLPVAVSVNGESVSSVSVDTSTSSEWVIRYTATNSSGTTAVERRVVVYEPIPEVIAPSATSSEPAPTEPVSDPPPEISAPAPEPAPAPATEPAPTEPVASEPAPESTPEPPPVTEPPPPEPAPAP